MPPSGPCYTLLRNSVGLLASEPAPLLAARPPRQCATPPQCAPGRRRIDGRHGNSDPQPFRKAHPETPCRRRASRSAPGLGCASAPQAARPRGRAQHRPCAHARRPAGAATASSAGISGRPPDVLGCPALVEQRRLGLVLQFGAKLYPFVSGGQKTELTAAMTDAVRRAMKTTPLAYLRSSYRDCYSRGRGSEAQTLRTILQGISEWNAIQPTPDAADFIRSSKAALRR